MITIYLIFKMFKLTYSKINSFGGFRVRIYEF